eukprot:6190369-Pleurochrysis_carterae.AAC.5
MLTQTHRRRTKCAACNSVLGHDAAATTHAHTTDLHCRTSLNRAAPCPKAGKDLTSCTLAAEN